MKRFFLSLLMFLLVTPFSLLKGECKYYRVTWTEITINSSCYVDSDGGGLEDPTINVYCEDGTTLNYSSEWEINIPNTGTYPIPPINWAFCSDTNEFLLGPIPEGMTSIDFFLEFFESDDNNCIDHADGIDNCITTGIGTLDLTPGIGQLSINGNTDVSFGFNLEEVSEVIEGINLGEPQCLLNNSYEIEIEVSYNFLNFCNLFPDSSPDLIINGNSFTITGSPQNVILNLPSDGNIVDIAISLSDNGCEKIFIDAFTAPSIPDVIINAPDGYTINCIIYPIPLDAIGSTGDFPLYYNWSTSEINTSISVNTPGSYQLTITSNFGCTAETSALVVLDIIDPVAIVLSDQDTLNCNFPQIDLDGSSSSGGGIITYLWSNGETTSSITVGNAGLYTLTVTDIINGCSNSTDITVWEDTTEPSISLELPDGDTINCNQSSLDIFSNSIDMSLLYSWNTGEATQNINIASPGEYQLTVSSSNGCTNSADTIIFADNIIPDLIFQLPQGNILNCNIQNITIDAQESTGEGNLIFDWENGIIDASINVDQSGYYILTITDAKGCSVIDSIEIVEDISTPEIIFSSPPIDILDCSQTMITLDASLSLGNSSLLFDWSSGQSQNTIDISSAGTYYLTITQTNGCIDIDSFKIYENLETPLIEIDFPDGQMLNCNQSVVIINANNSNGSGNLDFQWSTGESTEKIMVLDPGQYSMTVTDINGCTSSTMLSIMEDTTNPEATIVTPIGSTIDCALDSVILDASLSQSQGILEYSWSSTSTNATEALYAPGIYSVTITDINGCSDTASIEIDKIADFIVEYQTETPSCKEGFDGKIIISEISGGSPPYFYQLDNSPLVEVTNTPIVIQDLGNPEYNLTITDSSNCIFEDTAIITEGNESFVESGDNLTIDPGDDVTIQLNTNITNPYIIWSPSGTIQEISELEFLLSPEISTTYIIDVSNENGCQATDQITVFIKAPKNNIYTPNVFSPSSDNAKNKKFTFFGNFQNIKTVKTFSIYDRWGNQMYEITNNTDFNEIGWDGLMNNQRAVPGVYVFHIVIEYKDGDIESLVGDVLLLK